MKTVPEKFSAFAALNVATCRTCFAKSLVVAVLLWSIGVTRSEAAPLNFSAADVEAAPHATVEVPIGCRGSSGLSGARFLLRYDANLLTFEEAVRGAALPENALVFAKSETPGSVGVVFLCGMKSDRTGLEGMTADGEAVRIRFRVHGPAGSTGELKLDEVEASDVREHPMLVHAEPGRVQIRSNFLNLPWLYVGPIVGIAAFGLVFLLFRRRTSAS